MILVGPCMLLAPVVVILLPVAIVLWPFVLAFVGVLWLLLWPFTLLARSMEKPWLPEKHAQLGRLFATLLKPWNYFDLPQNKGPDAQ